jgi:hypothetical protein
MIQERAWFMDCMTLEQMKNVDVRTVDPNDLVDLNDVRVDTSLPRIERIKEFLRQIKNPYCYRVGKTIVKVSYAKDGDTLEDRLESLLMKILNP